MQLGRFGLKSPYRALRQGGYLYSHIEHQQATVALRESEERYRSLLDAAPIALFVCDRNAVIQHYNRLAAEMWGREPLCGVEQHCGSAKLWLPNGELLPHIRSPIVEVLRTGVPARDVEVFIERPDGSRLPVLVNFAALKNAQGEVTGGITSFIDITDRKRTEEVQKALRDAISESKRAERNLAFLASIGQDLVHLTSMDEMMNAVGARIGAYLKLSLCAFAEINEAADEAVVTHDWHREDARSVVGAYRLADFLTDDFQTAGRAGEIFVVRDTASDPRTDAAQYAKLQISSFVCVPLVKDGQWRFLLGIYHSEPYNWQDDEIELIRELTTRIWAWLERLRAEEAVRESKATLEFTLESARLGDWDLDLISDTSRRSLRHDQVFGYNEPVKEWGFGRFIKHVHPEDRVEIDRQFREALTQQKNWCFECRVIWADGSVHWISADGSIYRTHKGKPTRMLGIVADITGRKRLEAENRVLDQIAMGASMPQILETLVREAEAQSADGMRGSILLLDPPGQSLLHGAAPSLPDAYNRAIHGIKLGPNAGSCGTAAFERQPVFVTDIATDPRWVDFKELAAMHGLGACCSTPIFSNEGNLLGTVATYYPRPHNPSVHDREIIERATQLAAIVIERTQTQQALREAGERLRFVAEAMPQKIFTAKPNGEVDYFNPQWMEFTGLTFEQIRDWGWLRIIHPDEVAENIRVWRHSVDTGDPFHFEHRFRRADGEYRWHISRAIALKDTEGKILQWVGSNADVHEVKEAERYKDEFLALLAHELRGPLAPLTNMLEVMRRADGNGELIAQAQSTMQRQLNQMTRLIDDLLDVSRISRGKLNLRRTQVELASVVHHAVETCRSAIESAKHELTVALPSQPVFLLADPTRLAQVFCNLLTNASKYSKPGGCIALTGELQGGDIVVSVKDSGIGIPPEMLHKIFEMFTQIDRSEMSAGGLGLGLTLVQQLVQLHGGSVQALSKGPGHGSEFVVRLPMPAERPQPNEPAASAPVIRKSRRILVVDDNRDAADSLVMLLKLAGDETHVAYDGLEAVEAAAAIRPDVVLLDIGLPKLDGYEAARRIRSQRRGRNPVLVALTGWGQEQDRKRAAEAGFDAHMVKPLDFAALSELLTEKAG